MQEIVSYADQYVDIRLVHETPNKRCESLTDLRGVSSEQLLELVDDQKKIAVSLAQTQQGREHGIAVATNWTFLRRQID